ncbi:uncharacterized protein PV09_01628 [Verruconis gallopava]|uniref:Uncharacterized protein n=1 Tax=Verruconis gallopava TaxID=253628 RepID=A0A0D2B8V5_9PEZI|nr:uncharacterized protein PV09_01628 [Verruconis gallopava]KIW07689.1 hypothetical protein PV09_01628 [Verruconis gallopava]
MAPLRSRANRNQGDDETSILKGLPIRQWRLTEEKIGPPVEVKPDLGKQIFPELPLPRDFHLLPEISQQLLRKARAGQIYHSPTPVINGKDDKSKAGSKDAEGVFVSKKWTLVPRDKEAEEPTYLAKRRKGLPATFGAGVVNLVPQTSYRTTKVKKYDADGKLHVYEVLAPEGQQVEGEIVAEDEAAKAAPVEPIAAAPGTIVEGIGVVNEQGIVVSNDLLVPTPPRRKPPPPRRKPKKGPGRGKKKVLFEGAEAGEGANSDGTASGLLNLPGIASERAADSAAPSSQGDTPMLDAGDDDEGSGSEGEEGEDGDENREEGELSPSPEPDKPIPESKIPANLHLESSSSLPAEVKEENKDDDTVMMERAVEDEHKQEQQQQLQNEESTNNEIIANGEDYPDPPSKPSPEIEPKSTSHLPTAPEPSESSSVALAASQASSSEAPTAVPTNNADDPRPLLPVVEAKMVETAPPETPSVSVPPEPEPVHMVNAAGGLPASLEKSKTPEVKAEADTEVKKDKDGDVDLLKTLEVTAEQAAQMEETKEGISG